MDQPINSVCHNVVLKDRKNITLTGVCEILGFDENSITVDISDYTLTVDGSGLKIETFSNTTGETVISGNIDALIYSTKKNTVCKKGFFSGLFKNYAE